MKKSTRWEDRLIVSSRTASSCCRSPPASLCPSSALRPPIGCSRFDALRDKTGRRFVALGVRLVWIQRAAAWTRGRWTAVD
jgi:hypothetical protein